MATNVRQAVSRVRGTLNMVNEDAFVTDRYIYSLLMKYARALIKRDSRVENLYKYTSLFKELPCEDMVETDKIAACCMGLKTGAVIMRTRDKLPKLLDLDTGPVIRSVSTLDYSKRAVSTHPEVYTNMTRSTYFKYNKNKYYWFLDGHIYIPDVSWEGIRIQALFDEDVSDRACPINTGESPECTPEQDREIVVPEHLFAEAEQMVLNEILTKGRIPEGPDDSQHVLR